MVRRISRKHYPPPKRGQILEKINSNNLCLHNQNSQTLLNPSSGSFFAIDLTLSNPSIYTDYNWRVYKDPCCSDHYPIIMEKFTMKKLRTTNKTPTMEFQKSKLEILQKTMPYHTNPRIKYKSRRTHNTFYQHPYYNNK